MSSDDEMIADVRSYICNMAKQNCDPDAMQGLLREYNKLKDKDEVPKPQMGNGWRFVKDIKDSYHFSDAVWCRLRQQCEGTEFRNAIIRVSGRTTYVVERRWQDFLRWRAEKFQEDHLDPHLRQSN